MRKWTGGYGEQPERCKDTLKNHNELLEKLKKDHPEWEMEIIPTNQQKEIKYDARLWGILPRYSVRPSHNIHPSIMEYIDLKRTNGCQRDDSFSIGLSWMEDTIRTIVRNGFFRSYGIEKFVSR